MIDNKTEETKNRTAREEIEIIRYSPIELSLIHI